MIRFTDHLNTLIASNQPEKALEEIRKALRDYKISHPDDVEEIAQLEQQIILHSARLTDLHNKERNIQLSSSEIDVARSRMFAAVLGIISSLGEYDGLKTFLADVKPPEPQKVATPKPQPVQAGPPPARKQTTQSVSVEAAPKQKSSNGTLLGVLGTVAAIAVAVLAFTFLLPESDKPGDANQSTTKIDRPIPNPEPPVDEVPKETEKDVWLETKALGTFGAIEKFLEAYPDGEHAVEATALKAIIVDKAKTDEEELWKIATKANTVEMYNFYLRKTELGTHNEEAEAKRNKIEEGKSEKNRFAALQSTAEADTLDILERLTMWKSAGEEFTGEHLTLIKTKVEEYEALKTSNASITEEGNFVTCRTVSDARNPIQPGTDFQGNSVYYWARINAPKSESLSVKWMDSEGKEVGTRSHSVQTNTGLGYRIYSQMRFESDGTYEVRLFNSKDVLVARRVFTVGG